MIKVAHEAPLSIFDEVQAATDYDYCLAHLYHENKDYRDRFLKAKKSGREIILDNSIFELGTAFDPKLYAEIIKELKPTWYIAPDVLENFKGTIVSLHNWMEEFGSKFPKSVNSKVIGVVQGKNYSELTSCYQELLGYKEIKKIAISFDYSFYEKVTEKVKECPTKFHQWMTGRQMFLNFLTQESFFDFNTPLHLLGCSLPQEFSMYRDWDFIDSLDTSNPVVHGLLGVKYQVDGSLYQKASIKLFTMINQDRPTSSNLEKIGYNISKFRSNLS